MPNTIKLHRSLKAGKKKFTELSIAKRWVNYNMLIKPIDYTKVLFRINTGIEV